MTTRRNFLKGAGAVVAGAAIGSKPSVGAEELATPPASTVEHLEAPSRYVGACPRCGELKTKRVAIKVSHFRGVSNIHEQKRLRSVSTPEGGAIPLPEVSYVEGCEKCAHLGPRVAL